MERRQLIFRLYLVSQHNDVIAIRLISSWAGLQRASSGGLYLAPDIRMSREGLKEISDKFEVSIVYVKTGVT